jgi:hypothetical protein
MSLDLSRLESVRQRCGRTVARCPACAEHGQDEKGEHLVIMPDGRFGCVVCPGAAGKEHRKRIHALAGDLATRRLGAFRVRVRRPSIARPAAEVVDLARLGQVASDPAPVNPGSGGGLPEAADSVDGIGRFGRVSPTLALRVNESIQEDGEEKKDVHTRSVGAKASKASSPSSETATCRNEPQANIAARDIDPETGFPIIGGAICPF